MEEGRYLIKKNEIRINSIPFKVGRWMGECGRRR
jgi:hypothetical protein